MVHFAYEIGNGNTKPYIFVGPSLKTPFTSKANFAFDFGIGLENVTEFFVFAPELRYSYGLIDINQNSAIENLYFNSIALILNFR